MVGKVMFSELVEEVGLSVVKVWLALLLGNFDLQQSGGFYDGLGSQSVCGSSSPCMGQELRQSAGIQGLVPGGNRITLQARK